MKADTAAASHSAPTPRLRSAWVVTMLFLATAALGLVAACMRAPAERTRGEDHSEAMLMMTALPKTELLAPPALLEKADDAQLFRSQWEGSSVSGPAHVLVLEAVEVEALVAPVRRQPNLIVKAGNPTTPSPPAPPPLFSPPPPPPPSPRPTSPQPSAGWRPPWVLESLIPARPKSVKQQLQPDGGVWAYEVIDARPGVVLLSTGAGEIPGQPYFRDAAVLLVKVCEHHPMIFGVSLSTLSNETMAAHFCPSARQAYPAFVNNSIHLGGPIGPHWTVLHQRPTAGSLELAPGMHAGGCLRDAQRQVDAGRAAAADFHFYSGCAEPSLDPTTSAVSP